jgi:cell division protein ZapE
MKLNTLFPRTKLVLNVTYSAFPSLEETYHHFIHQHKLEYDAAQYAIIQQLQCLYNSLSSIQAYQTKSVFYKLTHSAPQHGKGLYIFGDVGRGKSMLMELFHNNCPLSNKRRVHFSVFMLEVHAFIHECQQQQHTDALDRLAKKISQTTALLCFDEFHITDIANAMLLSQLFKQLFALGVMLVITSNRHPNELYQGGLLREQFLVFISILENSVDVIELQARHDYRLTKQAQQLNRYYFPLNTGAEDFINQHLSQLVPANALHKQHVEVLGHGFTLNTVYDEVIVITFAELCATDLGPADYLYLSQQFSTFIIKDIPRLTRDHRNEAKRLVTLIDVLYEFKKCLICTAEVPATELYLDGDGAFEFRRTVSRLIEMQAMSLPSHGE